MRVSTEKSVANPPKYWRLLLLGAAAFCPASIFTIIAILLNPVWHRELLHLVARAWTVFVSHDVGSTSRGFLNAGLEAVFSIFVVAIVTGYLRGWDGFKKHLTETAIAALFAVPTVAIILYGTQFAWEVARVGYESHKQSCEQLAHLQKYAEEEKSNNQKVAEAEAKSDTWREAYVAATKGDQVPDREIPESQRNAIYSSLKEVAIKYHHPRIDIGYFDGDTESQRYCTEIYFMLKDAGFALPKDCLHSPRHLTNSDPPSPGADEGLSIQYFVQKSADPPSPRNELTAAINEAFSVHGIGIPSYPIGDGYPIHNAKYPVLWVGIKKANWSAAVQRELR